MNKLFSIASLMFMGSAALLSLVSILGIWGILDDSAVEKAFETIAFLGVVAIVMLVPGRFIDHNKISAHSDEKFDARMKTHFADIRHASLIMLMTAGGWLGLIGVFSIWDMLERDVLFRSISSIAVLGFLTFITVIMCHERENTSHRSKEMVTGISMGIMLLLGALFLTLLSLFSNM